MIDRDINSGININRPGLDLLPRIKRRKGNPVVIKSTTNSTLKEVARPELVACKGEPTLSRVFHPLPSHKTTQTSWIQYQVSNEREICRIMNLAVSSRVKLGMEIEGDIEG
ncbi:MAG: hypothetical protein QNJ70_30550 [Xenococcaceae cyanobacterium MO_207.B15]|nr:hypothetical protein [Xenococcaceae cyanobacterium MO_207.B15]